MQTFFKKKEEVISPAIFINGTYVGGFSHEDCLSQVKKLLNRTLTEKEDITYGFLTSFNRFVAMHNLPSLLFNEQISFSVFSQYHEDLKRKSIIKIMGEDSFNRLLAFNIRNWGERHKFSRGHITRIIGVFKERNIVTVGDLTYYSKQDLLRSQNLGVKGIDLICKWLADEHNWKWF